MLKAGDDQIVEALKFLHKNYIQTLENFTETFENEIPETLLLNSGFDKIWLDLLNQYERDLEMKPPVCRQIIETKILETLEIVVNENNIVTLPITPNTDKKRTPRRNAKQERKEESANQLLEKNKDLEEHVIRTASINTMISTQKNEERMNLIATPNTSNSKRKRSPRGNAKQETNEESVSIQKNEDLLITPNTSKRKIKKSPRGNAKQETREESVSTRKNEDLLIITNTSKRKIKKSPCGNAKQETKEESVKQLEKNKEETAPEIIISIPKNEDLNKTPNISKSKAKKSPRDNAKQGANQVMEENNNFQTPQKSAEEKTVEENAKQLKNVSESTPSKSSVFTKIATKMKNLFNSSAASSTVQPKTPTHSSLYLSSGSRPCQTPSKDCRKPTFDFVVSRAMRIKKLKSQKYFGDIYPPQSFPDLFEYFGPSYNARKRPRTSSADWQFDMFTPEEELQYKRAWYGQQSVQ